MGKVYSKLVESFGYIAEADAAELIRQQPAASYAANNLSGQGGQADTSPGSNTSSYTGDIGNATNDPATTDKPADPEKKKPAKKDPTKNPYYSKAIYAVQNMFNALGITDNAGKPIAKDGVWGWRTEEAKWNFFAKYPANSAESSQYDYFSSQVPKDLQWRVIPDRGTGRTARMGPDKAGKKDPQIGNPSPEAAKSMGIAVTPSAPGQSGQRKTGANPTPQEALILKSVEKLEAIFKKYGIQAECAYKADGSLLTEDDWVLKHINMFTPQEQMEIWKILSEAELSPFGSVGSDIAARRKEAEAQRARAGVSSAYKDSLSAGQRYQQGATAAAQNMPQQQSTLGKFGRNLAGRFGVGGGKRAAAKGIAKLGLRAIPFLGTAVLAYDIASALYDTFAKTEIADLDPADQQIITQELANITKMSQSKEYNTVSEETKKRVTAILNAANKMAQQAEA